MLDNDTMDLVHTYIESISVMCEDMTIDSNFEIRKLLTVGIVSNLMLSKKIFKRNSMVAEFADRFFEFKAKKYMLSSRTILVGKIIKDINSINESDKIDDILNTVYNLLKRIVSNQDIFKSDIYDVIKEMNF